VFSGSQVGELVELLETRGVLVHHACQYQDLVSYLALGGVPSRSFLQSAGLDTTPFTTDQIDRENRVWDKVFVNLQDYGRTFARGYAAVPNPYGPLLLRLRPSVLLEADDVAICLRSAGARGFDRERESLETVADVNRLFWKPLGEGRALELLKFRDGLRQEFGQAAQAVEVSCTCKDGLLSFAKLVDVVADPYTIAGAPLAEWTLRAVADSGLGARVKNRKSKIDAGIYDEIASLVGQHTPGLAELPNLTANASLLGWAERIRAGGLEYQFVRYADYLRFGTLGPLTMLARTAARDGHGSAPHYFDDPYEDLEDPYEDELAQLRQEAYEDAEGWARSGDEGWYYAD
jgi:hypothetical protein